MLARRLTHSDAGGARLAAELDTRPAALVVELAAEKVGERDTASVLRALEEHRILFGWQLAQADSDDWARFGASIGLKMAVKGVLANPAAHSGGGELTERLRNFLLLPGPGGEAPQRLEVVSATFVVLLAVPPVERQKLVLTLLELLALIGGLMMPIPITLLWHKMDGVPVMELEEGDKWSRLPSRDDMMFALIAMNFVVLTLVVFISVALAIFVSASGWHGNFQFYERVTPVLGVLWCLLAFCGIFPLWCTLFWQLFDFIGSPYPLILDAILTEVAFNWLMTYMWRFHSHAMALEVYHQPRWFISIVRLSVPQVWRDLSLKALEPLAKQRAAELRALMGIDAMGGGDAPLHVEKTGKQADFLGSPFVV